MNSDLNHYVQANTDAFSTVGNFFPKQNRMDESVLNLGIWGECGRLVLNCILTDLCHCAVLGSHISHVYLPHEQNASPDTQITISLLKIWNSSPYIEETFKSCNEHRKSYVNSRRSTCNCWRKCNNNLLQNFRRNFW